MDKKHQQASLLSDSLSEPEVPDLELVPPIKAKKRLRRMKLPSGKGGDSSSGISYSFAGTLSKSKSACTYLTLALIVICLVVSNIYFAYLTMDTRMHLEMLGTKMAKWQAENLEICEAKISEAQKKVIEAGALKVYESLNSSMFNSQQIESLLQGQISKILHNLTTIDNELTSGLKSHETQVQALAKNVTELRDICTSGCNSTPSTTSTAPPPKLQPTTNPTLLKTEGRP